MEPLLIALALAGGACAGVLVEHGRRRGRIGDAEREASGSWRTAAARRTPR